ncbi:lantibiotic dehydratase C-terminal domain-containing protein [Nonomuraea polychroma]|uniref:lantibiotic dehydratase C-terminal domain-containing protein n=1 Tax=Nonomuraea polychroma TaxID=46176 RepID=UPI003D8B2463
MRETAWVSAHAFYHADLDQLIVHAVSPLVTELTAKQLMERYFFLRYWDGGLHLRLRVLPTNAAARQRVHELIGDRFREYFAVNPATGRQSPEEYARMARLLARREGVAAYEPLPFPTNTLRYIPYQREHARYGYGADVEAVERHFDDSSRIALDLLARGPSQDQRASAGLAMILITWFTGGRPQGGRPSAGVPDKVIDLARQMRLLATRAAELPGQWPLVGWARSVADLAGTLAAQRETQPVEGPQTGEVLDLCAHLVCNRLGISPALEGRLRQLAARAVAVLDEEAT